MHKTMISAGGADARQSAFRVWIAVSAVWIAFWLSIAGLAASAMAFPYVAAADLQPFISILLVPPLVLLGLGAVLRWVGKAVTRITRISPAR